MRMLNKFVLATCVALVAMLVVPGKVDAALILTPAGADHQLSLFPPSACEPGCVETAFSLLGGSLSLLYKSDVDDGSEEGPYGGSYSTAYFAEPGDPEEATITFTGGPLGAISCPSCYLAVKGGATDPVYYLFDISTWDGTEEIQLKGFWPGKGAISHVSIWGAPAQVPEPASLLLFGLGTLAAGYRVRRRFVA